MMIIKCINANKDGTWIINTNREWNRIKDNGNFKSISEYKDVLLKDLQLRIKENIISDFIILK